MSYPHMKITLTTEGQDIPHIQNIRIEDRQVALCDRPRDSYMIIQIKDSKHVCVACLKKAVEMVFGLEVDADIARDKGDDAGAWSSSHQASQLQDDLEAIGITLNQDEEDEEIYHVYRDGQPWMVFHSIEWAWREADGKWEWEREKEKYKVTIEVHLVYTEEIEAASQVEAEKIAKQMDEDIIFSTMDEDEFQSSCTVEKIGE